MVAFPDIITKGGGVHLTVWEGSAAVAHPYPKPPISAFTAVDSDGLPAHANLPSRDEVVASNIIGIGGETAGPIQAIVHFWLWNPHRVRLRDANGDPVNDLDGLTIGGDPIDVQEATELNLPVGLHEMIFYISRPSEAAFSIILEVTYDDGASWRPVPVAFLYPEKPELNIQHRTIRMTVPSDEVGLSYASDLYVDPDTNELVMIDNAHAVAQHVGQRIHTFWGEWYLDQEIGIQWLQEVMGKRDTRAQLVAEALMRTEIMATPGVRDIVEMELVTDRKTRGILTRSLVIATEFDPETDVVTAF